MSHHTFKKVEGLPVESDFKKVVVEKDEQPDNVKNNTTYYDLENTLEEIDDQINILTKSKIDIEAQMVEIEKVANDEETKKLKAKADKEKEE